MKKPAALPRKFKLPPRVAEPPEHVKRAASLAGKASRPVPQKITVPAPVPVPSATVPPPQPVKSVQYAPPPQAPVKPVQYVPPPAKPVQYAPLPPQTEALRPPPPPAESHYRPPTPERPLRASPRPNVLGERRLMRRDFVAAAVGAGLFFLLAFVPALFGFDVFGIGRVLTGAAATAQQKLAADQQETLARLDELAAQVAGLESAVKDKAEDAPEKPDVTAEMSDQGGKGNGPPFSEVPIQRTELGKPSPLAEAEVESPATAELASVPDPIEAKATEESAPAQPASPVKADRISFTLEPGKSAYVRLKMQEGESAKYAWTVRGGLVNYDMQGKGQGGSKTYKSRREASSDNGTLIAGFSGEHGWLWRNAGSAPVILTMATRGQYAEIKGVP